MHGVRHEVHQFADRRSAVSVPVKNGIDEIGETPNHSVGRMISEGAGESIRASSRPVQVRGDTALLLDRGDGNRQVEELLDMHAFAPSADAP